MCMINHVEIYLPSSIFHQNITNKDTFYMMTVKMDLSPVRGDADDAALLIAASGRGRNTSTFFFTIPVIL